MLGSISGLLLMAPPAGGGGQQSILPTMLMFGAIILIMYFLMIRPQKKKQNEHLNMLANLNKGDKVITNSGIHGTIVDKDEKTFLLQISDNTKVRFEKGAVIGKQS